MRRVVLWTLAIGAVMLSGIERAGASGFLVPIRHPQISGAYVISYQHIDMKVDGQVCKVQVNQAFRNPGATTLEAEYFFPLPPDAAIDSFVMLVDGKEMPGRLLGRDEARRIYEGIVRRQQDPALMEYMGTGLFKTSVFPIPAGKERQINITFSRLCKREGNVIEIKYPLATTKYSARPIRDLKINCRINSSHPIKSVYSSTHALDVERSGEKVADVSLHQQEVLPSHDFALLYTISDADVGLSVLSYRPRTSEPGYFLLLASPRIEHGRSAVLPKSVIFVLDKSGSMTGGKIEQAKNALKFVVRNLNPQDTFNIITYDSDVQTLAPELQGVGGDSVAQALAFVERISAGGGTNIDGALRTAMTMLKAPEHPSYVIFLTDGVPTSGETREAAIAGNCTAANKVRARLMAFGVGDDVNARLIDKLVARNYGNSHYVRPSEDIEAPISQLFTKLSAPVLSYLELSFAGLDESLTYPRSLPDLFRGNQLVVVGRYHQPGERSVKLSGKVGSSGRTFTHKVVLDDHEALYSRGFIEKLWAERRVGYLIDEIDLHGKNRELIDEIVQLSRKHGILTPYTSFLADEEVELADGGSIMGRAVDLFDQLGGSGGGARGVAQRQMKRAAMRAAAPSAKGGVVYSYSLEGEATRRDTVFQIGLKTFFLKNGRWVDATLTEEKKGKAIKLVQYSDAYFDVIGKLAQQEAQYFALDGELLLEVAGQAYRVVPPE